MCIQKRNDQMECCHCDFCKAHDKLIWATINECKCGCHTTTRPTGHDSLCCPYPNGQRSQNPYKRLGKKEYYYKKLIKDEEYHNIQESKQK